MNIYHLLEIETSEEQYQEIKAVAIRTDNDEMLPDELLIPSSGTLRFSAVAILPVPSCLFVFDPTIVSTDAFMEIVEDLRYSHDGGSFEFQSIPMSTEIADAITLRCGTVKYQQWCIRNWGTPMEFGEVSEWHDVNKSIRFRSAGAPAVGVYKALSERFPRARFNYQWYEDFGSLAGVLRFENGELVYDLKVTSMSKQGKEIYSSIFDIYRPQSK